MVVVFIESCAFLIGVPMNRTGFQQFLFPSTFAIIIFEFSLEPLRDWEGKASLVRHIRRETERTNESLSPG